MSITNHRLYLVLLALASMLTYISLACSALSPSQGVPTQTITQESVSTQLPPTTTTVSQPTYTPTALSPTLDEQGINIPGLHFGDYFYYQICLLYTSPSPRD